MHETGHPLQKQEASCYAQFEAFGALALARVRITQAMLCGMRCYGSLGTYLPLSWSVSPVYRTHSPLQSEGTLLGSSPRADWCGGQTQAARVCAQTQWKTRTHVHAL